MPRILGICNPFLDRCAVVDEAFLQKHDLKKDDTKNETEKEPVERTWKALNPKADAWTLGGSGTNVMKTLARLGHECRVHGKVGKDAFDVEKRLVDIGIAPMFSKASIETGVVNCFVTPDKKRTMHTYLGSALELRQEDITSEAFQAASHAHFEGYLVYYGETLETCVSYAKKAETTTSFDLASLSVVEQFKPKLEKNVPQMDYVFGNLEEIKAYTGTEMQKSVELFQEKQTIIATDGKNGCWVKNKGEHEALHYDVSPVPNVIDTTGAGDIFAGAYLSAALLGDDVTKCVRKAHLAAGKIIQHIGADMPNEQWKQLKELTEKI
ncbi:MAG: adenosine kinase [Verrucomicrobia bacterium]|nr:adenosine kinase [Verrucomicrobiota bacterium]